MDGDVTSTEAVVEESQAELAEEAGELDPEEGSNEEIPEGEEDSSEEGGELQYYEDDAEYLKEQGIDGVEDIETLAAEYKKLRQAEEVRARTPNTYQQHPTPPQPGPGAQSGGSEEPTYKPQIFSDTINRTLEASPGMDEDSKKSYRSLGTLFDQAWGPVAKQLEDQRSFTMYAMSHIGQYLRDDSWTRFPKEYKGSVRRDELDPIMGQHGFLDYRQAMFELAKNRPELMPLMAKAHEDRGVEKGRKLRLRKSGSSRRGQPQKTTGQPWKPYVRSDGSLDQAKLDKLKPEQSDKIIDARIKFLQSQQ